MTARTSLLPVALLTLTLVALCGPGRAEATGWRPVTAPWPAPATVRDVSTFGSTGLAAAGDDGEVSVSSDGGTTWSSHVPAGFASSSFAAVAFSSAQSGVVASGGVVLVTTDGGRTWRAAVFEGAAPTGQVLDIVLHGKVGYLVGAGGTIFATADGGASWQAETSPTASDVVAVAVAGDGTAIAGTDAGEVMVRSAGSWAVVTTLADAVSAVAASASPTPGDGDPDLLVSAGWAVLGSDDGVTFAALDGVPAAPWPGLAWLGLPGSSSILAGPGGAGSWMPSPATWLPSNPGMTGVKQAVAPGGQSVAYLLSSAGGIARTLSAGSDDASASPSRTKMTVGSAATLTSVVRIAAPGTVEIDSHVPGRHWAVVRSFSWTQQLWSTSLGLSVTPRLTTEYRVRFRYGGAWTTLAASGPVEVRPKIILQRRRYSLRRGVVYRFSGRIVPALRGARLKLFTDRGGSWRPVSRGSTAPVSRDGHWTSRRFGAPKAERYHLRAYIGRTRAHGESWSAIVTVAIR
jgi:photosystem II stability/assembly factor-like uncharacterized protein